MKPNDKPAAVPGGQGSVEPLRAQQEEESGKQPARRQLDQPQGRHEAARSRRRESLAQPQRFFTSASLLRLRVHHHGAVDSLRRGHPALPSISAGVRRLQRVTSLVLFPFLLARALGQLVSGTLSDRFGRKPVLVVSGALFFVFSALCALAPSIGLLVLFRIPEGLDAAP